MNQVREAKKSETMFNKAISIILMCLAGITLVLCFYQISMSYYDHEVLTEEEVIQAQRYAIEVGKNIEGDGFLTDEYIYTVYQVIDSHVAVVGGAVSSYHNPILFALKQDGSVEYIGSSQSSKLMMEIYQDTFPEQMYYISIGLKPEKVVIDYRLYVGCVAAIIVMALSLVWLLSAAGHQYGYSGLRINFMDRIPLDIFTVLTVLLCLGGLLYMYNYVNYFNESIQLAFAIFCLICDGLIAVNWLISFAKRVKLGYWWRNSLIYYLIKALIDTIKAIPDIIKYIIVAVIYFIIFIFGYQKQVFPIVTILLVVYIIWWLANANKLKVMSKQLANGDLDTNVDTDFMPYDLKDTGHNLNSINEGMKLAIDKQLKSERLKTELITNVSHDIKTPLTSIITYTDLLQNETNAKKRKEYLEILSNQANRLKKLTEDLVDASKASTGNISVEKSNININELIEQSLAEYNDQFKEKQLEVIVDSKIEESVYTDGLLLWRVLNNLYSNVYKYAIEKSRVYIDTTSDDKNVTISIKNISRDQLNISPDELMERFVQGDSSRHSEGSGLGLNIAKSLTELLGGKLNITIDGDLFKVDVVLEKQ